MEEKFFKELVVRNIITSKDNKLQLLDSLDISMYGAKAWAFTFQKVGENKGKDYLFELGLLMGLDAADELKEGLQKYE
ncbi:MAG: hypothetical protein JRJ39_05270 [Deltaproteobacteria bacterium]|nr:hypothetical protein [Deltaproteobacteria bacterium]